MITHFKVTHSGLTIRHLNLCQKLQVSFFQCVTKGVNFILTITCVHIPITLSTSVHLFQRTLTVCYAYKTLKQSKCYFYDSFCEVWIKFRLWALGIGQWIQISLVDKNCHPDERVKRVKRDRLAIRSDVLLPPNHNHKLTLDRIFSKMVDDISDWTTDGFFIHLADLA